MGKIRLTREYANEAAKVGVVYPPEWIDDYDPSEDSDSEIGGGLSAPDEDGR
jgi:hypothetical protein